MEPKEIVFVHGVQWVRDIELAGYSLPLQHLIQAQAPTTEFKFNEVLWSDIVEVKEQELIAGVNLLSDLAKGDLFPAVLAFLNVVGSFVKEDRLRNIDYLTNTNVLDISNDSKWLGKAMSVVLDVILYFATDYGKEIRTKVRNEIEKLNKPPVLMGHSLGSVILFDILKEDADKNKFNYTDFLTAATPLGLFRPNGDITDTDKKINWVNMYDPGDLVGFWNPLVRKGYTCPFDTRIKTSEFPFYSHVKYWTSSTVADELVDMALSA